MPKGEFEDIFPFKLARYVKSVADKGDYIIYYIWDVQKGDKVAKKHTIPSKFKSQAEKQAYGKDYIIKVNKLLKAGFHIDRNKSRKKKEQKAARIDDLPNFLIVEKAIEKYINYCQNKLKNNNAEVARKKRTLKRFFDWASVCLQTKVNF